MQVSRYLSLILLALALDSCSQRDFDFKTEGEKLLRRDAEWADLATAGKDVEKVVSYWSDDAVLVQPLLGLGVPLPLVNASHAWARSDQNSTGAIAKKAGNRLPWPGASFLRPPESRDAGEAPVRIAQSPGQRRLRA